MEYFLFPPDATLESTPWEETYESNLEEPPVAAAVPKKSYTSLLIDDLSDESDDEADDDEDAPWNPASSHPFPNATPSFARSPSPSPSQPAQPSLPQPSMPSLLSHLTPNATAASAPSSSLPPLTEQEDVVMSVLSEQPPLANVEASEPAPGPKKYIHRRKRQSRGSSIGAPSQPASASNPTPAPAPAAPAAGIPAAAGGWGYTPGY